MTDSENRTQDKGQASMWVDHNQAVIINQDSPEVARSVGVLVRESTETESAFLARIVDEVIDDERVVVGGPEEVRTAFDRAYVAVTHHPDHLVDVEPRRPSVV